MIWIKRIIRIAALGVVLYLFWPLLGELRAAFGLFREARWGWLAAASVIAFASYACLTALNLLLLRPFEGRISFWRLMVVLPTLAFIEVALPSAGASGVVLRARLLGRSGYSLEASTFTLVVETIFLGAALTVAVVFGLIFLVRAGDLGPRQAGLLIGLAAVILVPGALAVWAGGSRERSERWALGLVGQWNRIAARFHRPPVPTSQVEGRVASFYEGLARLGKTSHWALAATTIGRVALDLTSLGACFLAFRYTISPGVLLTGYGLMLVFGGLASFPGGLGMADASLAVIFARLGAPGAVAVAAALSYRLVAFWLLRFIGFINWQLLESRP